MSTRTRSTTHAGCCCPPTTCGCPCCTTGFWSQYTFTFAGISDNGIPCNCATLNGSFTANRITGGCAWVTGSPASWTCTFTGPFWVLSCSGGTWNLSNMSGDVNYQTTSNLCVSGGTLSLVGPSSGFCTGYPSSITITPGGVWTPCP